MDTDQDAIKINEKESWKASRWYHSLSGTQTINNLWKSKLEPGVVFRPMSKSLGAEVQRNKQQTLFGAQGEQRAAVEPPFEAGEAVVHRGHGVQ